MKWVEQRVEALAAALEAAQCPEKVKATWLLAYERGFFNFLNECRWEMHRGFGESVADNMAWARAVIVALKPGSDPTALSDALRSSGSWISEQLSMSLQPGIQRLVEADLAEIAVIVLAAMAEDLEQSWDSIECCGDDVDWNAAGDDLQPLDWQST